MHVKWRRGLELVVWIPILVLVAGAGAEELSSSANSTEEQSLPNKDERARGDKDGIVAVSPTNSPVYLLYVYQNGSTALVRNDTNQVVAESQVGLKDEEHSRKKRSFCKFKGTCGGGGGGWGSSGGGHGGKKGFKKGKGGGGGGHGGWGSSSSSGWGGSSGGYSSSGGSSWGNTGGGWGNSGGGFGSSGGGWSSGSGSGWGSGGGGKGKKHDWGDWGRKIMAKFSKKGKGGGGGGWGW